MSALLRKPGFKFGSLFAAMFLLAAGLFVYAADPGGGQNDVTLSLTRAPDGDTLDHGTKVDVAASVDCSGADISLKITFLAYDQGPELDEDPSIVIYESPAGTKDQDSYQIDTGARKPGSYWIEVTSSKANNSPQTDYFTIGQYLPGDAPSCWIHFDSGDAYQVGASWYIKHGGAQSVRCEPTDKDKDYQGNELDDTFDSSNAYRWYCAEGGEFDPQKAKESTWTAPTGNETKANVQCYIDDDGKYYNDLELPTLVDHGTVVVHLFTLDSVTLDKTGSVVLADNSTLKATTSYRGNIPGGKLRYVLVKDDKEQDGVEDGDEHTFQISEPGTYAVKVFFDLPNTGAQSVTSTSVIFLGARLSDIKVVDGNHDNRSVNADATLEMVIEPKGNLAVRSAQLEAIRNAQDVQLGIAWATGEPKWSDGILPQVGEYAGWTGKESISVSCVAGGVDRNASIALIPQLAPALQDQDIGGSFKVMESLVNRVKEKFGLSDDLISVKAGMRLTWHKEYVDKYADPKVGWRHELNGKGRFDVSINAPVPGYSYPIANGLIDIGLYLSADFYAQATALQLIYDQSEAQPWQIEPSGEIKIAGFLGPKVQAKADAKKLKVIGWLLNGAEVGASGKAQVGVVGTFTPDKGGLKGQAQIGAVRIVVQGYAKYKGKEYYINAVNWTVDESGFKYPQQPSYVIEWDL